jgi:hypothetical protein
VKRLGLWLLMLAAFGSAPAFALTCIPAAGCSSTSATCKWSDTADWQSCGGGLPGVGDTVDINKPFIYDRQSDSIAALLLDGDLIFDPSSTNRDADGFRTLTVAGDVSPRTSGKTMYMGPADRLLFDSTAARRSISFSDGANLIVRGGAFQTTIAAVTVAAATNPPCGATTGRMFTIKPASGFNSSPTSAFQTAIRTKRRIRFASGMMTNEQLEIARVNADGTFDVCTNFLDAAGAFQRLTPHATYTRTYPLARHSVPIPIPIGDCTGANAPWWGCTGAGTMNAVQAQPAVGDAITIYNDAFIGVSAGANGLQIFGPSSGIDPLPTFQNVTFYGLATTGTVAAIDISAKTAGQAAPDFKGVHIHDSSSDNAALVRYRGVQGMLFDDLAVHDNSGGTDGTPAISVQLNSAQTIPPNNDTVTDSIFWRNRNGDVLIGTASLGVQASGAKIQRNTMREGCLTTNGVCVAAGVGSMKDFDISQNRIYWQSRGDFKASVGDHGNAYGIATAATSPAVQTNGAIHDNWVVNIAGIGIQAGNDPANVANVNNYVSHTTSMSASGGDHYSGVYKNWGLYGDGDADAIVSPGKYVKGVYLYGIDPAYMNTADCVAAVGTGTGCNRHGIVFYDQPNLGSGERQFSDIVCASLYDNQLIQTSGANQNGSCINSPSGATYPTTNVRISHLTADDRGVNYNYADETASAGSNLNPDYLFRAWWINDTCNGGACSVAHTYYIDDIAALGMNDYNIGVCQAITTGITKSIGTFYRVKSDVARSSVGAITGGDCASQTSGEHIVSDLGYMDPYAGNYNLRSDAAMLAAGADPAGSAVGIRAFRFNRDFLKSLWGAAVTFDGEMPADISNGTCTGLTTCNQDSDGDEIPDLNDNCDRTINPSQYDSDADGAGDACDP